MSPLIKWGLLGGDLGRLCASSPKEIDAALGETLRRYVEEIELSDDDGERDEELVIAPVRVEGPAGQELFGAEFESMREAHVVLNTERLVSVKVLRKHMEAIEVQYDLLEDPPESDSDGGGSDRPDKGSSAVSDDESREQSTALDS